MTTNAQIDVQALIANAMAAAMPEIEKAMTKAVKAEVARIAPKAPAAPKAPKAAKAAPKVRFLTRKSREELVKVAPRFAGMSTKQIAAAVVAGEKRLPKGWAIGEGYKALVKGA